MPSCSGRRRPSTGEAVPPLVRTGVSNFFGNLSDVWSFVNSVLQFKIQDAADNFMRLNVNTLFGLGGILDIASEVDIDRHSEDFGQTLGRWGVPAGPVPRAAVARALDPARHARRCRSTAGPTRVTACRPAAARKARCYVLRVVDVRSNLLRAGQSLDEAALDKYSFTRDAYLQRRRAEIFETSMTAVGQEPAGAKRRTPRAPTLPRSAPDNPGAPAPAPAR